MKKPFEAKQEQTTNEKPYIPRKEFNKNRYDGYENRKGNYRGTINNTRRKNQDELLQVRGHDFRSTKGKLKQSGSYGNDRIDSGKIGSTLL